MFDYVLDTRLNLVVNEVWVDEEPISLIHMKKQKIIAILNVTMKSRASNTLDYWI